MRSRRPLDDVPATVTVVPAAEIDASGARRLNDQADCEPLEKTKRQGDF